MVHYAGELAQDHTDVFDSFGNLDPEQLLDHMGISYVVQKRGHII